MILWTGFNWDVHQPHVLLAGLVCICSQLMGQLMGQLAAGSSRGLAHMSGRWYCAGHLRSLPQLLQQASPGFLAGRLGSEVAQCCSHCWTRQPTQTPGNGETGRWGSGNVTLQRGRRDGRAVYNHLCKVSPTKSEGGKSLRGVELGSDIFKRSCWLF